ncbi:hypothetical protein [Sorangium cellulosum]|uniref:hypothetical protein n=1 Tax=Sorangium cellulosum TaxID=56 RepID=UPI0013318189|nr:hypothetical protein [Sorangium cellulosum]
MADPHLRRLRAGGAEPTPRRGWTATPRHLIHELTASPHDRPAERVSIALRPSSSP